MKIEKQQISKVFIYIILIALTFLTLLPFI